MQVSLDRLEGSKVKLNVEVEPERVNQAFEKAYIKVRGQVRIPGFRKGKAPRPILETYVGKDVLSQEAVEILLPEAYRDAVAQAEINPVDRPEITIENFEEAAPFTFTAEVVVKPEVEIEGYKGLTVEKRKVEITEEDVDREVGNLRERLATYESDETAAAAEGDIVIVDFEGRLDGELFEGGSGKDVSIQIGAGRFLKEMEDAVRGAKVGEELEADVPFPEDYHATELAGRTARFKITVKAVRVRKLPELDDELVKKISASQSVEDFRREMHSRLLSEADRAVEQEMRSQAVDRVVEMAEVAIPDVMIAEETDHMLRDLEMRLRYQRLSLQQYLESGERSLDDLREEFKPQAEMRVKAELTLDTIARKEGLEVPQEELDAAVADLARSYGRTPERMAKEISEAQLDAVRSGLLRDKAIELLLTNAEIKEVS